MRDNKWVRLLAYITGLVNQRLLLQCEYLIAENRILRSHIHGQLRLADPERSTLAGIAKRLGRKYLTEVACVARPETILAWYRRLIAHKFDGSKRRQHPGRPHIDAVIRNLVIHMARENSSWGYDRIAGALATSVTTSRIRPSQTFSSGTASRRLRYAAQTPVGRTSSRRIWRFWPAPTSSR